MKKFYPIMTALTASLLFVGCINDELEDGDPTPIRFTTRVGDIKSSDLSTNTRSIYDESTFTKFNVTAFDNVKAYFENLEANFQDDNSWKTTVDYYWPQYSLNFYGYAPASLKNNVNITADVHEIKDYTVKTNVKEQDDVITSYNNASSGTENGKVPLFFRHAMVQVELLAKNGSPIDPTNTDPTKTQYQIEVLGAKLCQIPSTATLTFQNHPDSLPKWSTPTGLADYMVKSENGPLLLKDSLESIMFGTPGFLMIPQQLTAWTGDANNNNGAYIAVLCRIKDKDGNKIYPKSSDDYAFIAMPIKPKWIPGKKHTFTLMFFTNGGGAGIVPPDLYNPDDHDDPDVDVNPGIDTGNRVIPDASMAMVVSEKISAWEQGETTTVIF